MRILFTLALVCLAVSSSFAQRNRSGSYNRIGIAGGYEMRTYDGDLDLTNDGGFYIGLQTRGAFKNNWDMVYGVTLSQSNFSLGRDLEYQQYAGQIKLMPSYNIISRHLNVDLGLTANFQGSLERQTDDEDVNAVILAAGGAPETIETNLFGAGAIVGLSGGFEGFRATLHYEYSITNVINDGDVQARSGRLLAGVVVYL